MKTKEVKVTFQPLGRSVYVLPGTLLLEAAGRAGIILQTPCGGHGTCGKCRVKIIGAADSISSEQPKILTKEQFASGYRLACQTWINAPVVVDVPQESMFESWHQILVGHTGKASKLNPVIRKIYFQLDEPTSRDVRSDQARLRAAIGNVILAPDFTQFLPVFLRSNNWRGTAVLAADRLIGLEKGDTSADAFGVAFDLGTTTIVGTLINLTTGKEVTISSEMNSQVGYGDDVIARILKIRENARMLTQLQQSVLGTVNHIIADLAQQVKIHVNHIYEIVVAGNSTMQQIFCGFDPSALGELPFVQVFDEAQTLSAARLGLKANPGAEVFVFPQIGGFVGGDTVAGILASRLDQWDKPVIFVDIGTNGEIVLSCNGQLLATSTAAGPAFEGARINHGMRATAGAIEKVIIRNDVVLNVIGNSRPVGICGTALIDTVAELLRCGIVDTSGRILSADDVPPSAPKAVCNRLITTDGETNFILAAANETASGTDIYLSQKDVREVQLATGAIRAGINILLRKMNMKMQDLGAVLLAGAFGNFIRRSNARRMGLLPQIPCDHIHFIGNAASLGAKMALLSVDERKSASYLRNKACHVDLSLDPEFQMEFANGMIFPDTDFDTCKIEE